MFADPKITTPRDQLEAEIERIFASHPLDSDHVELVLDSYSEPWRAYHNCEHILKMLKTLKELSLDFEPEYIQVIEIMIVYHDVRLKLGREKGWNERESAVLAARHLQAAGYGPILVEIATEGIECSIDHKLLPSLESWKDFVGLFLDIDLFAGFGTNWDEFSRNTSLIEQEFSPIYTSEEYRLGRAHFATSFLDRGQIFLTEHFAKHEEAVRASLTRMAALG